MKKSILKVVHDSVKGLFGGGIVNAKTMHEFDALCKDPVTSQENKKTAKVTQELSLSRRGGCVD